MYVITNSHRTENGTFVCNSNCVVARSIQDGRLNSVMLMSCRDVLMDQYKMEPERSPQVAALTDISPSTSVTCTAFVIICSLLGAIFVL